MNPFRSDLLEAKVPEEGVREAFGDTLAALAATDPNLVVLTADLAGSTTTAKFGKVAPERFLNIGISEQDMIGTAAGLALTGKTVFASTFAIFLTGRCWEQVRQSICHAEIPVKLVSTHGGISVGPDGGSHQMIEDIAVMRCLPHMRVIVVGDAEETRQAIRYVAQADGPFYVRTSRIKFPQLYTPDYRFEFGKGVVFQQSPEDTVTLIGCGVMVKRCLIAAKLLEAHGVKARVINMHTIKPIDTELVGKAAAETGLIVTVEEHNIIGGLGSAVCEAVAETHPCLVRRLGIPDVFGQSGQADELFAHFGLTPEGIVQETLSSIQRLKSGKVGAYSR